MRKSSIVVSFVVASLAVAARAEDEKPVPAAPAAPAKHENKISPEAKAAFEKMEKIANCPVRQGVNEAAGTITAEMMGMPVTMKFTFKAPAAVKVEPDENMQGQMEMAGRQMARGAERTLKVMFGVFRPADDEEFDAEMTKKDGKDVLVITNYKDGAEQGKSELTLDANGLIASGVGTTKVGPEKREAKSEAVYSWAKSGDTYRLEKLEMTSARPGGGGPGSGRGGQGGGMGGGQGGKIAITLTYTPFEKTAIATSWKTELGGMSMVYESRISELTVNGKKVEIAKPAEAKKPETGPKEKDEDGEEDDGDDEDEGGGKGGMK